MASLSLTNREMALVAIIACLLVAAIIVVVHALWVKKRNAVISSESLRLKALRELNAGFSFKKLFPKAYKRDLDSKQQFDRFDPDKFLMSVLYESSDEYEQWIDAAEENAELLREYNEGLRDIPPSTYEKQSWVKAESKLFKKETISPDAPPVVLVEWSYVSPAGRNHYRNNRLYTIYQTKIFLDESMKLAKRRRSRQARIRHERALMTDSLRYDVLKRDNFTCQICGSTAQDGVKLEVDHIIPVSKGGRTELSNLQTLCDRCNRGKRDKD